MKKTIYLILRIFKYNFLLYPLRFTLRYIYLNLKLSQFEKKVPFKGEIGINKGWFQAKLSEHSISTLTKTYGLYKSKNNIEITLDNIQAFKEVFKSVGKQIKEYLGINVKVDGMFFFKTDAKYKSISSNWHTDNVGSRIKVFVCIEGDGSQPTLILSPLKNINSLSYLLKVYFIEVYRWIGFNFRNKLNNPISLRHQKGSIFALYTAVLTEEVMT